MLRTGRCVRRSGSGRTHVGNAPVLNNASGGGIVAGIDHRDDKAFLFLSNEQCLDLLEKFDGGDINGLRLFGGRLGGDRDDDDLRILDGRLACMGTAAAVGTAAAAASGSEFDGTASGTWNERGRLDESGWREDDGSPCSN